MMTVHNIKDSTWKLMQANRRYSSGHSYTLPSPDSYPYQWFWDSCFHAIILRHFNPEWAEDELRSLAARQFENGMIPHMIYWEEAPAGTRFPIIRWGRRRVSSLVQPPMLAQAVWTLYEVTKNKSFLKEMLPVINRLHHYLWFTRDPRRHHLIGLVHPDESGEDNSPRFDHAMHLRARQTQAKNFHVRMKLVASYKSQNFAVKKRMERFHWVRDVPMNAIFADNLRFESRIAHEVGDSKLAELSTIKAEKIVTAMRQYMLDDELMWATAGLDYKPIKIKTWAIFAPLLAKALTHDEAELLVKNHLLNRHEFKTPFMLPSVAKNEPSFDPKGFWRGPVWITPNWFVYNGLKRYGFDEEAAMVAQHTHKLLNLSGFREQYNPLTGEGMGAINFTWGGLALDMPV